MQEDIYEYQDVLYHHGVKGMKWGRRKRREARGGLPGKRRLRRQIRRLNRIESKKPGTNKHTTAVGKKIQSEIDNSKEWKSYNKDLKSGRGVTQNQIEGVLNRKSKVMRKYQDELRGAALKDLGYEDTKAGREYIKKYESYLYKRK